MHRRSPKLSRARNAIAITAILLALVATGHAQTIDAHGAAGPARLDGPWLLYEGDPPSEPRAVDSRPARTYWLGNGNSADNESNVVWLHASLSTDEPVSDPALLVNPNADECQLYVNGQLAADCSHWPRTNSGARRWLLVHLPGSPAQVDLRIVGRYGAAARLPSSGDILFGSAQVLAEIRAATDATHFYELLPQALLCLGELIGGVVLLLVFANDRSGREYLWFAAFLFLDGTMSLESVFSWVYPLIPRTFAPLTDGIGLLGRYALLVGFIAAFTGIRINQWIRAYQILLFTVAILFGVTFLSQSLSGLRMSDHAFGILLLLGQLPFIAGSLGFLAWKWRHGNREAGLLLPSFLLASLFEVLGLTVPWFQHFIVGRFSFEYDDLSMFFFLVSIGPVMLFRHRRTTIEQARVIGELEAAREIQEQLVTPPPAIPGFVIECAYRPAARVGGDFYRVSPEDDGGVLIVVGDVSGKGLPAAMTVSAIVGSLRTLSSCGPADLLHALNRSLAGNLRGGFVTCLVLRISPDGNAACANAGHLAPYLDGKELSLENGLPLGLAADARYSETSFHLPSGAQITLLTDGVVEAQDAAGTLFGFDHTAAISRKPADQIAQTAELFGQEDDITVLTLARFA